MTKVEKQIPLGKLQEYATAFGFYCAMCQKVGHADEARVPRDNICEKMNLIQEILKDLNIDYAELKAQFISEGKNRYNEVVAE